MQHHALNMVRMKIGARWSGGAHAFMAFRRGDFRSEAGLETVDVSSGTIDLAGIPTAVHPATPVARPDRLLKECTDKLIAAFVLVLASPLLVLLGLGVKLSSPGPVLFRQVRHGWDGRPIEIWKFRSMRLHQDRPGTVTQARRGDPRITAFGAFMRRTSLDELPQFFNVLQGRMSIVGPRPHAVAHSQLYQDLIPDYLLRHRVKPGITGWAQVNGLRGETDTLEKMRLRVEYDLYYIRNWSFWLDLSIMARTACTALFDRNAY